MTRILAHAIGGGWDLRHEGCAPRCCEREARTDSWVGAQGVALLNSEWASMCGGCGARIIDPPAPMTFDRDAPCEAHEGCA